VRKLEEELRMPHGPESLAIQCDEFYFNNITLLITNSQEDVAVCWVTREWVSIKSVWTVSVIFLSIYIDHCTLERRRRAFLLLATTVLIGIEPIRPLQRSLMEHLLEALLLNTINMPILSSQIPSATVLEILLNLLHLTQCPEHGHLGAFPHCQQ